MNARAQHIWDVTPVEAVQIQRQLAPRVVREGAPSGVRLIAGTDISAGNAETPARAAVVVVRWPEVEPVEQSVVETEVRFPYVPGLLSFREIPALLPAFEQLRHVPDLIIVDGQGFAHPRRFGLASHLGLVLDLPSIGCAKSRLIGMPSGELGEERGSRTPLIDHDEVVGELVRTRSGVNPVYVSVGYKISLDAACDWVLALATRYRLPEPTRLAHQAAAGRQVVPGGA